MSARSTAGAAFAALCLVGLAPAWAQPVAEPDGYRTESYRGPTPATLKGARVVTTSEAAEMWRAKTAVFVDVLPRAPKPANLPPDTIWRDKPRPNIPGSIWLPDTGYGALAPATEAYFAAGLRAATQGDATRVVVIYCQRDCWMSWNGAKRALAMGYRNVAWYPDGTDGWQDAGLPLEEATPAARAGD